MGDIHGRLDLLSAATAELTRLAAEAETRGETFTGVFLGDYIDRGPHSREVLEALVQLERDAPGRFVFLRGNHEAMLLDVLAGAPDAVAWLNFGGAETLRSYGLTPPSRITPGSAPAIGALLKAAIPPAHLAFLNRTELFFERGRYLFVHAGVRPDRLLGEQSSADMLWYRYYSDEQPVHDAVVVHGHSPGLRPLSGRWRIGIDTEAYASGNLTLLKLAGDAREFIRIRPETAPSRWPQIDVPYGRELDRSRRRTARRAPPGRTRAARRLPWISLAAAAGVVAGAAIVLWTGGAPEPRGLAPPANPAPPVPPLAAALRPALTSDLALAAPVRRPPAAGERVQPDAAGHDQAPLVGFRGEADATGFCGRMRKAVRPCIVSE